MALVTEMDFEPISFVRDLLRSPLAAPPGGRGFLRRIKAWHVAAVIYTPVVTACVLFRADDGFLDVISAYSGFSYALAAPLLMIFPIALAASAWSREKQLGTAEALVLAPAARSRLVWGRWLHLTLPWAKVLLLMLPLYLLVASNLFFARRPWPGPTAAFTSKLLQGLRLVYWGQGAVMSWSSGRFAILGCRAVNDLSILLFAVSAAFWLSARCRTPARSYALSLALIPLLLMTVLGQDIWMLLAQRAYFALAPEPDFRGLFDTGDFDFYRKRLATAAMVASVFGALIMAVRFLLAWLAVRSVVLNFDRFLLGEPARDKPA